MIKIMKYMVMTIQLICQMDAKRNFETVLELISSKGWMLPH